MLVEIVEQELGISAEKIMLDAPAGRLAATYADVEELITR
jgi:hypothetical protein